MRVTSTKHGTITLDDNNKEGGEGKVYKILAPSHLTGYCVKIYKETIQKQADKIRFMEGKIRFMVDNPPAQIEIQGKIKLGWPVDTIMQNNSFVGFMMPLAFSGSKELISLIPNIRSNSGANWQKYNRDNGTAIVARLKLMHNMTVAIQLLHQTGKYVLRDFKPQNVLVTHSGEITVCDMDSIQIAEGHKMLFRGTAETDDYRPPEYYNSGMGKSPTDVLKKSWDSFALAAVYYQLLLGLHPYTGTPKIQKGVGESCLWQNIAADLFPNGKNSSKIAVIPPPHEKFKVLPQLIQELFKRSFSLDAANRPSTDEWGNAIYEIIKPVPPKPQSDIEKPVPPKPQFDIERLKIQLQRTETQLKEAQLREQERLKQLERAEAQLKEAKRSESKLKNQIRFLWFFAALFVIAAGFAIVYYNKSESQSSKNNRQHENEKQMLTEEISNLADENCRQTREIENKNNEIANLKMQRTQSYYETQPPKQEPQIKPLKQAPTAVTKTRTTDKTVKPVIPDPQPIITVPAKEILAKQALEKANAAFQKGIKADTGNKENFEEAYKLYLEYNKKEGYKKFKERADQLQSDGLDQEYQYFIDYANSLK